MVLHAQHILYVQCYIYMLCTTYVMLYFTHYIYIMCLCNVLHNTYVLLLHMYMCIHVHCTWYMLHINVICHISMLAVDKYKHTYIWVTILRNQEFNRWSSEDCCLSASNSYTGKMIVFTRINHANTMAQSLPWAYSSEFHNSTKLYLLQLCQKQDHWKP